jgi:MoaA/NifB/PqqE/SkfB family radical SAM enzyme
MTELRQHVLANRFHPKCKACDVGPGEFSYARFKNKDMFRIASAVDLENLSLPKVMNISLSSTCNLACRMCSASCSSKLSGLATPILRKYVGPARPRMDIEAVLHAQADNFRDLVHVTMSGGEPMFDKNYVTLVELLLKKAPGLRSLNMSTNLTVVNHTMLRMLAASDTKVSLSVSLDGPPHIHEYVRQFSSWAETVQNLQEVADTYPGFRFNVNSTINALNVGYIGETLDALNGLPVKFDHLMASPVLEEHMHAGVLPQVIKQAYKQKLDAIGYAQMRIPGSSALVESAKALLMTPMDGYQDFKEYIEEFDGLVGKDFASVYGWKL